MIAPSLLLLAVSVQAQLPIAQNEIIEIQGIPIKLGPMADTEDGIQWKILAGRDGIDSIDKLSAKARQNLDDKDILFDFQRAEVSGVGEAGDSNDTVPGMFDKQVKTSNLYKVRSSPGFFGRLKETWDYIVDYKKDVREALSDTRGIPSEHGKEIISQLKGKKINELFAHSWGTEAVYLGILNGEIPPPSKLYVVGVPEDNRNKWLMLAKYTGIEVHVVGFTWDMLKVAGDVGVKWKTGLPGDAAGLENLWKMNCAQRSGEGCADPSKFIWSSFDYNMNVTPSEPPPNVKQDLATRLDHDRSRYYRHLFYRDLVKRTAYDMASSERALIEVERMRILSKTKDEARQLITQAQKLSLATKVGRDLKLGRPASDAEMAAEQIRLDEEFAALAKSVADQRAAQLAIQKRAQEEYAARQAENAEKERRNNELWSQIDSASKRCGYGKFSRGANGSFPGFHGGKDYFFFSLSWEVPLNVRDYEVALMVARACHEIEKNTEKDSPKACSDHAASQFHAVGSEALLEVKLRYIFGHFQELKCIGAIYGQARAGKITDTKSFEKAIEKIHKELKKAEKERREAQRRWNREHPPRETPREAPREPREPRGDSPRGGCFRGDDPFGCQPKHPKW